jgi:hypothetical protein
VQGLIDLQGGSFLCIPSDTPILQLFGDPCPGYPKDLRINFEIVGKNGSVKTSEVRGFLKKKIFIKQSPTIKPLLLVNSAFYGVTATSKKFQLDFLNKQIAKILIIEHKFFIFLFFYYY